MQGHLKKLIFTFLILILSNLSSISSVRASDENRDENRDECKWVYFPQKRIHRCLNSQNEDLTTQLEEKVSANEIVPREHTECLGRRTLSRDSQSNYSFGCKK